MTVESAKAYIQRMREDADFHRTVNECEDDAANWAYLQSQGYEFTMQEFKEAQDLVYQEHGLTPFV